MSTLELVPWCKDRKQVARELEDDWSIPPRPQGDRLFTDFFDANAPHLAQARWDEGFSPDIDVRETDRQVVVTVELPGMSHNDVEITLTGGVLMIEGEKRSEIEEEEEDNRHYRLERSYGAFRRALRLPPEIDADEVSAGFDNGILKVTVAKKETAEAATRRIEVKNGAETRPRRPRARCGGLYRRAAEPPYRDRPPRSVSGG